VVILLYSDRHEAGERLAELLQDLSRENPVVLGVPRGGVVVAARVAHRLTAPMDVVISRKIGAPGNPELAVAAVTPDGDVFTDHRLGGIYRPNQDYLQHAAETERQEIQRRLALYRGKRPAITLKDRAIIVVDDGVATGLTMAASLSWVKRQSPASLVLAVPVAPPSTLRHLEGFVDRAVCPLTPAGFYAVGQFYRFFEQTPDEEVIRLLSLHNSPGRYQD
jgi:predicted phosphoribosyltransferase